jgi:hypothetical protein
LCLFVRDAGTYLVVAALFMVLPAAEWPFL